MVDLDDSASAEAQVLAANSQFYACFEEADVEALGRLWLRSDSVTCVHPGSPPVVGHTAVMQSWRLVFGGPGLPQIACENVHIQDHGGLAIVLCTEVLPSARLAATKVFIRCPEGWRLIHHQASEIAARPRIARVPVVRAS